jgi:acetolactate synthase I/II/III large subunit
MSPSAFMGKGVSTDTHPNLHHYCLISNGLATMAFALPGAIAAKLARPQCKVLAAVGDGAFLMSSQELETAVRERILLGVLIWVDRAYGLIKWKMDMELGHHAAVDFSNPDFSHSPYRAKLGPRGSARCVPISERHLLIFDLRKRHIL